MLLNGKRLVLFKLENKFDTGVIYDCLTVFSIIKSKEIRYILRRRYRASAVTAYYLEYLQNIIRRKPVAR